MSKLVIWPMGISLDFPSLHSIVILVLIYLDPITAWIEVKIYGWEPVFSKCFMVPIIKGFTILSNH